MPSSQRISRLLGRGRGGASRKPEIAGPGPDAAGGGGGGPCCWEKGGGGM